MGTSRRLAILGLAVLSLYLFYTGGGVRRLRESVERGRMKNVVLLEDAESTAPPTAASSIPARSA